MKVALIQLKAGTDKHRNILNALRLVRKAIAKRAKFILLPEVFSFRGRTGASNSLRGVAENIPGESTRPLMGLAARHKVSILAGSLIEKGKGGQKVYNTSVLINDKGQIAARYRKMNLFKASLRNKRINEGDDFLKGTKPAIGRLSKFMVGLTVCYDLRFPGLYQYYSQRGADIICVPSAFTDETGQAHWESLLRARAIENFCYILAPDQIGVDNRGINCFGNSMIVDPWGKIIARASRHKEGIIYGVIDKKTLEWARGRFGK